MISQVQHSLRKHARIQAFTLIELLITVVIIAVLAAIGMVNYQRAKTQARVSVTANNIRVLMLGMESYSADHGDYPRPVASLWDDPAGVVASSAVSILTTPVAYVTSAAFSDPFGSSQFRHSLAGTDMFGMPISTFNESRSLIIFHYPTVSQMLRSPTMNVNGYALVSLGPDEADSFILYHPFPGQLPSFASAYGIQNISDMIYDPTNGSISAGDIAGFGGESRTRGIIGTGR